MKLKNILAMSLITATAFAPHASAETPETVVDLAVGSDVHTTLVQAVVAADLADTLSSEGPFTVFAPTNSAFDMLPAGTVSTLLEPENIDMLRGILTYHVVAGHVLSTDLTQGLVAPTVEGSDLVFTHKNDAWYVNSAKITAADLVAENGVVHVIDSVIMPPVTMEPEMMTQKEIFSKIYNLRSDMDESLEDKVDNILVKYSNIVMNLSDSKRAEMDAKLMVSIDSYLKKYESNSKIVNVLSLLKYEIMANNYAANDIVDIAVGSEVHSTLVTAVTEANLVSTLQTDGPFTVFAPVNNAFAKLPDGTVESLLAEESKASLTNILTYHVVPGAYFASDITDGLKLTTVNGDTLDFTIEDGVVNINGLPTLLVTDIATSNGVIHVINDVLMSTE